MTPEQYGKARDLAIREITAKWKAQEMKLWERYILGLWPNGETPFMQMMKEMSPVPPSNFGPITRMFDYSKMRYRPDLIIMDDVEDLHDCKTKESRDSLVSWCGIDLATKHKPKKEIKMSNKARIGVLEDELSELRLDLINSRPRMGPSQEYHSTQISHLERQIEALNDRIDHTLQMNLSLRYDKITALCEFLGVEFKTIPTQPAQPAKLIAVKIKKT